MFEVAFARAMISAYEPFFGTLAPSAADAAGVAGDTTAGGLVVPRFGTNCAGAGGAVLERLGSLGGALLGKASSGPDGLLVPRYGIVFKEGLFDTF